MKSVEMGYRFHVGTVIFREFYGHFSQNPRINVPNPRILHYAAFEIDKFLNKFR